MNHLRRSEAPISESAWSQIDTEARRTLTHFLAGRALVDFTGPLGWDHASVPSGRTTAAGRSPVDGVSAAVRTVHSLIELRAPFVLSRDEIDAAERGAPDLDLGPLEEAARRIALAEDEILFAGFDAGAVAGMLPSSPHAPLDISDDYSTYPDVVTEAVSVLRQAGIGGPYAIALGTRCYNGVLETTEPGGYPVLQHVEAILGGAVLWAPAVDGAVVLSQRGGDYELVCGEDLSVGFRVATDDSVELYLEETLTMVVHEGRAAVALRHPAGRPSRRQRK